MEDAEQSKLFVGGISWETTEDVLRQHFGRYGVVLASVIAKDRFTGSPRGFAFVTFSESSATERALRDSHEILSRTVEVKRAIPRSEQQSQQQDNRGFNRNNSKNNSRTNDHVRTKKIFVGGLSADLTEEEFRGYFEKFGRITDVVVMHDNVTHRPRGFGFISFDSEDSVDLVMRKNFHELTGKLVEVKRAVPKDGISSGRNGQNGRVNGERVPEFNSFQQPEFNSFQQEGYIPYNNRFGPVNAGYPGVSGYGYGSGMFGGGYYPGGYSGFGYGLSPIADGGVWTPTMAGNFMLYGGAAPMYQAYGNGTPGVPGLAANGYGGILGAGFGGKSIPSGSGGDSQSQSAAESSVSRSNVVANSFGYGSGTGSTGNNGEKGNDNTYPASDSS